MVRMTDVASLSVVTNKPYHSHGQRALLTWHGGDLDAAPDLFPDKLANLHGHQMRVVTFHFPPRIFMKDDEKGKEPVLYGVDIEVCAIHQYTIISTNV